MNRPLFSPEQQAGFAAFAQSNPLFGGGSPFEGATAVPCGTDRVMLVGGQFASYLKPESIVPFEAVFRRLPIDGIFTATPSTPCQFEMGSVQVPINHGLVVLDSRFAIYRPSGVAAGDFVELEENRLPTQVGWDIQSNISRQGNYRFELNPIPPFEKSNPGYQSANNLGIIPGIPEGIASPDAFESARASQAQGATGQALSLMPQRHTRQGLLKVPASWILHSNEELILSCTVFRAIQIPIAFFEAEVFGFMLPDQHLIEMQKAIAPCIPKPRGP